MQPLSPEGDKLRFLGKRKDLEIDKLFRALVKLEGSDLHLKVGVAPYVRVAGTLRPLNRGPIDDDEMVRLIFPMFNERTRRIFDEDGGHGMLFTTFDGQLMMALHAPNNRRAQPRLFKMEDTGETLRIVEEFTGEGP